MRSNEAFLRVLAYIDANNITKAQIMAASDATFEAVMFPDGRPAGDYTSVAAVKRALIHVYRERLMAARLVEVRDLILAAFPDATFRMGGDHEYIVRLEGDVGA